MSKSSAHKEQLLCSARTVHHRWPVNLVQEDLLDFRDEVEYQTYDCYLKYKGRVSVSPDAVVYHKSHLDYETVVSRDQFNYYRFRHLIKKEVFSKKIQLAAGQPYLLAADLWSAGHFHWICDTLPRLWLIREQARQFILLLPDLPYLRTIGKESLELLGLHFKDILWMNSNAFYRVPELYFISPLHRSGQMNTLVLDQIREKFLKGHEAGNKRVYISRGKQPFRKVINESELLPLLREYNFEIIHGEELSLKDQILLFSATKLLMGIHGAGLANAIFQHQGAGVIELRKKENGPFNVGYWHLADALDLQYYYYNGLPDSELPLVGKAGNLLINSHEFEEVLLKKIADCK